ncbi:MAG: glycosyltransferase family 2 protein [Pseudoxanthomonas sp.]
MSEMLVLIAFWGSLIVIAFTYVGYPLWVLACGRLLPNPVRKCPHFPRVTAILAVYNAADSAVAKVENLLSLDYPPENFDIVVACDGCTDATADALRLVASPRLRVVEFPQRRGKAACLADLAVGAAGDVLLMVDVRQHLERDALTRLAANFADPDVGAVSGELCFTDEQGGFAAKVGAYWRYEKMIRNAEARSGSVVGVTGALYAIRRELYVPLPAGTVLDDVLTPMHVVRDGYRVVFEAGAVAWDRPSTTQAQERVRKIRTLAGNYQAVAIAPWLVVPFRNPLWFRFVSHKLLRLLVPWLLCVLAVSSTILAFSHPLYLACLLAGLGGLALVMAASWLPSLSEWMPVRLLSTFLYMNLYAGQALVAYVRNPRLHLW